MFQNIAVALTALAFASSARAFDYSLASPGSIVLADVSTGIAPVETIFLDEEVSVTLDGLEWDFVEESSSSSNAAASSNGTIFYKTFVDDELQADGEIVVENLHRTLPSSLDVGTVKVSSKGSPVVKVTLQVEDQEETSSESTFQAFKAGTAIIPLIVVLLFAVTSRSVEFSLVAAIFVGACMITGNVKDGFTSTLERYILEALADIGHGYVYLFTMFLSGMVGMLEKSGGMFGFARDAAKYATTSRSAQMVTFAIGCIIFFDDYANVLLAGETMRPLTDLLFVSREKLSFIVDATSAPVASLTPVSSWVGFEVGLIQDEIDKLISMYGEDALSIESSGLAVFMQSIKYRYYPIFMLFLMPIMIYFQRDIGPMLIAERKTQVYKRNDGGDGKPDSSAAKKDKTENQPEKDTPFSTINFFVPIILLIFFIFYLLIQSGNVEPGMSFLDMLQASDSYVALLWGVMAAALCTMIFYGLQVVQDGKYVFPTPSILLKLYFPDQAEDASNPRSLMNVFVSIEAFLYGMSRIFPALIVLTLAWAVGAVMTSVGVDRLFSSWIVGGVSASALPTLSFLISIFMALATGTSWGTMTILFPLLVVPSYQVSGGDAVIVYATVAGILSGSVAGDHVSPISDTTVLSALACDCKLLGHVSTQAPHALLIIVISILFGTVPIGGDKLPNIVGILLGMLAVALVVFGLFRPIISETGSYDIFSELYLRIKPSQELDMLKEDTKEAFLKRGEAETLVEEDGSKIAVSSGTTDNEKELSSQASSSEEMPLEGDATA